MGNNNRIEMNLSQIPKNPCLFWLGHMTCSVCL